MSSLANGQYLESNRECVGEQNTQVKTVNYKLHLCDGVFSFPVAVRSSKLHTDDAVGHKENIQRVNVAGYLNTIASSIAEQLGQNKDFTKMQETPMAILSIVDMNDFKKTSPAAKRISENLIHEMQVRGYKVIDYKAMNQIEIDKNGEYVFSRAMKDLKNQRVATCALSGTYAKYKDGMVINCRIIDIKTSIVLSTAQVFVPRKVLRKIERVHKKNTWFTQLDRTIQNAESVVMIEGN